MSIKLITAENQDEQETASPHLIPLPGGKDPTNDWLSQLPVGTVLLVGPRPTPQNAFPMFREQYEILQKANNDKEVRLYCETAKPKKIWINSKVFSKQMELVCVLGSVEYDE